MILETTECNNGKDLTVCLVGDSILLYMPNIDYSDLESVSKLNDETECKKRVLCIPITLPVMDISKQLEYAGIRVGYETMKTIEGSIRSLILNVVNNSELKGNLEK